MELRRACCLRDRPRALALGSTIMTSSDNSSRLSWVSWVGLEPAVVAAGVARGWGCAGGKGRGSRSMSVPRTWRMTSASRRTSCSIGALSSMRAARTRAKLLILGWGQDQISVRSHSREQRTHQQVPPTRHSPAHYAWTHGTVMGVKLAKAVIAIVP